MERQRISLESASDKASTVACLRVLAEPFAVIALCHLSPDTRALLQANALSIHAHPLAHGGLLFIGAPQYRIPAEPDLAHVSALAAQAGVQWILFDSDGPVVEGLPTYR